MSNPLSRLWRLPIRRKLMLAEAFAGTLTAWTMIRFTPYAAWRSRLGFPVPLMSAQVTGAPARNTGNSILEDIAWAHAWLARLFGRRFTCLMLAFSARAMLRRRKFSSLLVLGAKRGQGAAEKLGAHAWVLCQGFEIVGGETRDGHIPVAAYGAGDTSVQERSERLS
jgi:Transglutaminase-like superfamily